MFVDDVQRAAAEAAGEPTRDDGGPLLRGVVTAYDPPRFAAMRGITPGAEFEAETLADLFDVASQAWVGFQADR